MNEFSRSQVITVTSKMVVSKNGDLALHCYPHKNERARTALAGLVTVRLRVQLSPISGNDVRQAAHIRDSVIKQYNVVPVESRLGR